MVYRGFPKPSMEEPIALFDEAQHYYASNGITTVQKTGTLEEIGFLSIAVERGSLFLDIVAYA